MVRELSKHQSASCLIVVFVMVRFTSLSCYSSVKTRIQLVKSYQINESFWLNNPLCIAAPCVSFDCHFDTFSVSRAPNSPIEFTTILIFKPEPEPAFELHFRFSIAFSHRVSVRNITVLTLQTCKSMQVPFNI